MVYAIESPYCEKLVQEDNTHAGRVFAFESLCDLREFCHDAEEWNDNYRFRIPRHEAYKIMEHTVFVYGYRRYDEYSSVDELYALYCDIVDKYC